MRCGVAQSVTRVGNTSPDHCRYGIGYLLARSVLYEALTVIAATYPSDVILVNHILSIFSGISLRLPPLTEYMDCNRRVNRYEGTGRAILGMEESGDPSKHIRFASDCRF